MKTVTVNASKTYEVKIGSGLLSGLGAEIQSLGKVCRCAIISDSTVWPLYGPQVKTSLECAGFHVCEFIITAGEASKNGPVFLDILNFLATNQLTRSDLLIALGGGVVGDITGFSAACYLRGIRYIQLPTTLLAAVDSSVGGKTAIDLPAGKNLCGAFWQPSLVLCDTDTLRTLPANIFRDGCAEVIKYAILYDCALFAHLEQQGVNFDREDVIARCVQWKQAIVSDDEFDTGSRMKLNLGHTFGHGIEAKSNFTVSHGQAVAMGIAIAARTADCPDAGRIVACLESFGLPTKTDCTAAAIAHYAVSDKKRSGNTLHLILPRRIGYCEISPTPVDMLESITEKGL